MTKKPVINNAFNMGMLEKIANRYDPENDAGNVTWCDENLAYLVRRLIERVAELEERINVLEHTARASGSTHPHVTTVR